MTGMSMSMKAMSYMDSFILTTPLTPSSAVSTMKLAFSNALATIFLVTTESSTMRTFLRNLPCLQPSSPDSMQWYLSCRRMVSDASANCCAITSCWFGSSSLSIMSCATALRLSSFVSNWGNIVIRALCMTLSPIVFVEPVDLLPFEPRDMRPSPILADIVDMDDRDLSALENGPPLARSTWLFPWNSILAPDSSPISSGFDGMTSSGRASTRPASSGTTPATLSRSRPTDSSPWKYTRGSLSRISSTTSLASAARMSPRCLRLFVDLASSPPPTS
mmetsp:Transcript_31800/g.75924  ORF Transcript_31800/g.75924 Transcript_31800/m.75924 type:complete len:276 (-) Transcript_31800:2922-3749(-)